MTLRYLPSNGCNETINEKQRRPSDRL